MTEILWIVTVKFKPHRYHVPAKKIVNNCQTSVLCTDSTGGHHCFLVEGDNLALHNVMKIVRDKFPNVHVTRYERAKFIEEVDFKAHL